MSNITDEFEHYWRTFMEVSYDGVLIADSEGRIVYMNSASERMGGVKREAILGRYARDLEAEGVYETSVTVKVFKTRQVASVMEFKGEKQLVTTGIPIFENGTIKWVYINERDATEINKVKRDGEKALQQVELYKKELKELANKSFFDADGAIFNSAAMRKIISVLERVAGTDVTVLLEGESGTGKNVLARWIHYHSPRAEMPLVTIDCGALPESLLESELFGYQKGAFTGANKEGKMGLVEAAHGGTLILDEIGELPLPLQVKLLRLLQSQTFIPVGGVREQKVNLRIVASTNRDLSKMVRDGAFRKDLYFRLGIVPLKIPPIRERYDDILPLILFFLRKYNEQYGLHKEISAHALNVLCTYTWPGNVREISNMIERLVVVTPTGVIDVEDVEAAVSVNSGMSMEMSSLHNLPFKDAVEQFEAQYLKRRMSGKATIQQVADAIGVSKSTLKRKLRQFRLPSRQH